MEEKEADFIGQSAGWRSQTVQIDHSQAPLPEVVDLGAR